MAAIEVKIRLSAKSDLIVEAFASALIYFSVFYDRADLLTLEVLAVVVATYLTELFVVSKMKFRRLAGLSLLILIYLGLGLGFHAYWPDVLFRATVILIAIYVVHSSTSKYLQSRPHSGSSEGSKVAVTSTT
jgi:hypothetical protein